MRRSCFSALLADEWPEMGPEESRSGRIFFNLQKCSRIDSQHHTLPRGVARVRSDIYIKAPQLPPSSLSISSSQLVS